METTENIIYEYPLNKEVEVLLHLESHFNQINILIKSSAELANYYVIDNYFHIFAIINKSHIQKYLIQTLKKHYTQLATLANNQGIDTIKLKQYLNESKNLIAALQNENLKTNANINFLASLKKNRSDHSIYKGSHANNPTLRFWLKRPKNDCLRLLKKISLAFKAIENSVQLILKTIRHSAKNQQVVAKHGFFQVQTNSHKGPMYQLVRVALPKTISYFPEFSGSQNYVAMRFITIDSAPTKLLTSDIHFTLCLCH